MSNIEIKPSTTCVTFQIHASKTWGVLDEFRKETVRYDKIDELEPFPQHLLAKDYDVEEESHYTVLYWIPQARRWIAFHFQSINESDLKPNDESYLGPYLWLGNEAAPSKEEVENASRKGELVVR